MADTNEPVNDPAGAESESELNAGLERAGYNALWLWFGLDRASWLTIPRVMMHEMPDDWQARMAQLLTEWNETWDTHEMPNTRVQATRGGKLTRFPDWLKNYRHPDRRAIDEVRSNA